MSDTPPPSLVPDARILASREQWQYRGQVRPSFALEPGVGQESVWDYPRPPRLVPDPRRVEIRLDDRSIAESERAVRVLETASPPTWYLPPEDVAVSCLVGSGSRSICEWKGVALDFDLRDGPRSVAWCYAETFPEFSSIAGWFAFYPARVECRVAGERVRPQSGGYYGGWITSEIVGPCKGEPGCDGL